ncbi:hypothetical protein BJ170DRAFT_377180 [Xylariales sp. AK1849]|nr:hypothetical protein BJ170DRAFT_377180 [Xylariales sp. AK1849]
MEGGPHFSIASESIGCLKAFDLLLSGLEISRDDHKRLMRPVALRNQRDRLKIWAGNLGALQQGRASLDFRLGESSLVQTAVLELLKRLKDTIIRSNEVVRGLRPALEEVFQNDKEQTWEDSSESDEEIRFSTRTELGQNMSEIIDILSNLFKLSFKIRNPATRSTEHSVLRALTHKEIIQLDETTSIDLMQIYSEFDRSHVEESFQEMRRSIQKAKVTHEPDSVNVEAGSDGPANLNIGHPETALQVDDPNHYMIERWSKSITNRRRYFAYWRRHARKLAKTDWEEMEAEQPFPKQPNTSSSNFNPTQAQEQINLSSQRIVARSATGKTILSGTEGTTYDRKLGDDIDAQSTVSYASTAYNIDGSTAELPSPPVTQPGQSEFTCLYCWVVCPLRHKNGKSWREHVIRDLQPYMCTYPDCLDGDTMYTTRASWLDHEAQMHRKVWRCFEHTDLFKSKEALRHHLEIAHQDLGKTQAHGMADLGDATIKDERTVCPFCLSGGTFQKDLANHMAFHMEKLACFAVPRNTETGDDGSSNRNSSNGAQGAQSIDSLRSVVLDFPPAGSQGSISSAANSATHMFSPNQHSGAELRYQLDDKEALEVLYWLHPVDYSNKQSDYLRKRQSGTGEWFLDSPQYKTWLSQRKQTLLCLGGPGTGKTIITSIVVNDLSERFRDDITIQIAYVYCDLRRQYEQRAEYLLSSLLRQLVQTQPTLPDSLKDLHNRHKKIGTRPSMKEISRELQAVLANCSRAFIIIDALDECRVLDGPGSKLVSEIQYLQTTTAVNFFATSRNISNITTSFTGMPWIEIRESTADISKYLDYNIEQLPSFVKRSTDLQAEAKTAIIQATDGNFLFATLYFQFLMSMSSPARFRGALHQLASGAEALDSFYYGMMQRIQEQETNLGVLANQVLLQPSSDRDDIIYMCRFSQRQRKQRYSVLVPSYSNRILRKNTKSMVSKPATRNYFDLYDLPFLPSLC